MEAVEEHERDDNDKKQRQELRLRRHQRHQHQQLQQGTICCFVQCCYYYYLSPRATYIFITALDSIRDLSLSIYCTVYLYMAPSFWFVWSLVLSVFHSLRHTLPIVHFYRSVVTSLQLYLFCSTPQFPLPLMI